jgi:hypothetical protein
MISVPSRRVAGRFAVPSAMAFALCIAALLPVPAAEAQAAAEARDQCFFAPPEDAPPLETECGYVVVHENPDRTDGPEIRLGYLRIHARATDPKAPFFMLAGGPGGTFINPETLYLFNDAFLGPILDERDVVLLDQRGRQMRSRS